MPRSIHEIKDYWLDIHAEDPLPQWLFDVLDILLELEEPVDSSTVTFRESCTLFSVSSHSNDCLSANMSWIWFEQAPYLPSNFIAIGDSVMRASPAYGYVLDINFLVPGDTWIDQ